MSRSIVLTSLLIISSFAHANPAEGLTRDLRDLAFAIVPADRARVPERAIAPPARAARREIARALFGDAAPGTEDRVLTAWDELVQTTALAATDVDDVSRRLAVFAARAMQTAHALRHAGNPVEARHAVQVAAAAIGWAGWLLGTAEAEPARMRRPKRQFYYFTTLGVTATGLVGGLSIGDHSILSGAMCLVGGAGVGVCLSDMKDVDSLVDKFRVPRFIKDRDVRRETDRRRETFWFALEAELSKDEGWREWVRGRARRAGVPAIVDDVRDRLRDSVGPDALGDVCAELLTKTEIESPFR